MSERRVDALIGAACFGAACTGFIGIIAAIVSIVSMNLVGAGVAVIGAGLAPPDEMEFAEDLAVQDFALPAGRLWIREIVDRSHPRIFELWWAALRRWAAERTP